MGFFIPEGMKSIPNWVLWKKDGEKKIPYSAVYNGRASVTNSKSWTDCDTALSRLDDEHNKYDGAGFVFTLSCGLVFIDLDHCVDESGEMTDFALEIIEMFSNSYAEYSQSGNGIHIVTKGVIPHAVKRPHIEIYSDKRYMAFTGDALNWNEPMPSQHCLNALFVLCNQSANSETLSEPLYATLSPLTRSDKEIILRIEQSVYGALYCVLSEGRWQDKYKSQSQADMRLISLIWSYCFDEEQTKRIFMQTKLARREKAFRSDYVDRTIQKVAENNPKKPCCNSRFPKNKKESEKEKNFRKCYYMK